jgi:hypothetical protein
LLKEHIGLPVVTSTAETSTRRDFKSAWKGCPPELRVRKHAPLLQSRMRTIGTFFCASMTRIEVEGISFRYSCYHCSMNLLLTLFLSSLTTLAVVHYVALEFFLYWRYLWFDIPMHLLGGTTVALGISILPFFRINIPRRFLTLFGYVSIVLCVGLAWEAFELIGGISILDESFVPDTITDLCMDILGGLIGYALSVKMHSFKTDSAL